MGPIAFGIFDHLERRDEPLDRIYQGRFELGADADQAGFFCYHVAEHHATPLGMAPSPGVFLAALAQRTKRLHVGPLVYLLPLYTPLRLVQEICMIDQMSGGRLEVGVGRGISPFELGYYRVPFMESREMFEEALEVVVTGLRNRRLSHRGTYYRYDGVPVELEPFQKPNPPFWYGAATPESVTFAARHGMNVVGNGTNAMLQRSTEQYREELAKHKGGAGDLNPQIEEPWRGAIRHIYVAADEREAETIAKPAYRAYYNNITKLWRDFYTTPTHGFTPDLELAQRHQVAIAGTASEVTDIVGRFFEESGCNYLVLSFAWGDLTQASARGSLERFATKVMPHFANNQSVR
ncbi:MAG TPA: LLM class flavin-dependent oxidoreductase [Candidatus Binataceae bacterium]|nr:LLM class flavin-dependent oxidoreductase [Candidatus Binataceae bacterium]